MKSLTQHTWQQFPFTQVKGFPVYVSEEHI
jgi:hypothetical protein